MSADTPAISGASVVKLARGVRLHEDPVRGQMVLLAPERAMALDDIAVAIVQALDGKRSLDRIAGDFAAKFDAPVAEIAGDVRAFAQELAIRRLLEIVE
ncbi:MULTISPECIES: pyrroloquinoline quinone biosynthesis peptide chaperone PqqD [unclassified Sinorhizobium]|uniref:pyrroloquinoline quinone biosynthesis peptide chaperone PqqD n=1 Tax=unclassified Sinorhizobium TaxID=2613772 RepID=UPI0024C26223|nr:MULTISPECIES: pyrroloquinoline quinone biosynthesis peptide chaperone PqqD [unclassified Sinorhizobium]MDK1377851.1 pyrroloquinoline quinone biosynthesis peptide chaperone PqqD [Sinorhizobium sp. 6-70]MDK1479874.1 pyrroloquinoline quinone biosynthesis peptide chaperone PqqD [Sinorhizobium sp. 6-117]